ncbi:TonB-dependent receptor [SAR92 clade bacterium H231]|nr:TonB-dependent receptor [SAR92 clade bacterium H231]
MNTYTRKTLLASMVGLFAAGGASGSLAQGGEAATEQGRIDEIIVTANRRAESLNDAALSIAAIGGEEISRRNLTEMNDYLRTMPGVNFIDQGAGRNAVVVRGITIDPELESALTSPTTGLYFGEVPLAGFSLEGGNANIKMIDLDRVEVLRGPQGTLFGSGSLAGAVRNIPKQPNMEEFEGAIKTGYSNTTEFGGDNTKLEGVINIPLVEGILALRAVSYRHKADGYVNNIAGTQLATGGPIATTYTAAGLVAAFGGADLFQDEKGTGGSTFTGGRIALKWTPTTEFDVTLQYLSQKAELDGRPYVQLNTGGYTQATLAFGDALPNQSEKLEDDISIINMIVEYDFGWASLLSSSAYVDNKSVRNYDITALVGLSPLVQLNADSNEAFIQEIRLVSKLEGPMQFITGLYFEDIVRFLDSESYATGDLSLNVFGTPFGATNPLIDIGTRTGTTTQKAVFGELSYDVTEQVKVTIGARYFDYEKTDLLDGMGAFGLRLLPGETEESGDNYKASVSYVPNEDMLMYATWSEGFRLGNSNLPLPPSVCDVNNDGLLDGTSAELRGGFDSDSTENIEFGIKMGLAENRVQVNASLYQVKWNAMPLFIAAGKLDSQATQICFGGTIVNVGDAESNGFELETSVQLTDSLRFNIGGGYTNVELSQGITELGFSKGDRLPSSPEYNANMGLAYDFVLAGNEGYVQADYAVVSEFYNRVGEAGDKGGDYGQFNMNAGIVINNFTAEIFAQNLTNEDAITSVGVIGFDTRAYRLRPRTIGLNIGYHF